MQEADYFLGNLICVRAASPDPLDGLAHARCMARCDPHMAETEAKDNDERPHGPSSATDYPDPAV
jgi:hypothetical protein